MARIVEHNIESLLKRSQEEERTIPVQNRVADTITRFAGSMPFVYLHGAVYGLWILINLGITPLPRFDPSFVILAMAASVEAIFLSTFILITQNRMSEQADRRADLDLQISLLAEHEITRLITLISAIAERMGIEESRAPELSELKKDVAPEEVLNKIDETKEEFENKERKNKD